MKNTIGERIANLRKKEGLTQVQLAEKLNISDKAVSKWESNKGDPSLELLILLSEIFDCSIDYIVKGKESSKLDQEDKKSVKKELTDAENLFNKVLERIKYSVSEVQYDLWIKNIKPVKIEDKVLVLNVETETARDLIRRNFLNLIYEIVRRLDGNIEEVYISTNDFADDQLLKLAVKTAILNKGVNTSMIQRELSVGFATAAGLIDDMENLKYISKYNGHNLRHVFIDEAKYEKVFREKI